MQSSRRSVRAGVRRTRRSRQEKMDDDRGSDTELRPGGRHRGGLREAMAAATGVSKWSCASRCGRRGASNRRRMETLRAVQQSESSRRGS